MAFITKHNFKNHIIKHLGKSKVKTDSKVFDLFFNILNKHEIRSLLIFKEFLKDTSKFMENIDLNRLNFDTFTYVYQEGPPAFHRNSKCDLLRSNFDNFVIPYCIKNEGKEYIDKYRSWFKDNEIRPGDILTLEQKESLIALFGADAIPNKVNAPNSRISEFTNNEKLFHSEEEVKNELINKQLELGKFISENSSRLIIFNEFRLRSKIPESLNQVEEFSNKYKIATNETIQIIDKYLKEYKYPIINLIEEYYLVKYNPKLNIHDTVLQNFSFKVCNKCGNSSDESILKKFSKTPLDDSIWLLDCEPTIVDITKNEDIVVHIYRDKWVLGEGKYYIPLYPGIPGDKTIYRIADFIAQYDRKDSSGNIIIRKGEIRSYVY